ncbi:MAG: 3-mercaptopropionate dioxygenase [Chroococcidiopsis sp. SAG 2025]|uniref:cysteine dioxygenase family protein n=1 Tax=Chroococcidiopsis sp. SAG 2025 TaxID=171389 RepID=UPI002936EDE7|nr:cupin [Chroococcidiopsis sp. SAG 2025]MDV2992217.1 3-mercaptopropionate dioxygenase [Chroococcidiopsis sp. SAG 2025]
MTGKDWLVRNDGQCLACDVGSQTEALSHPYRLYRFLTDLEDILDCVSDNRLRLQAIRPLVRKLLTSSSWLQIPTLAPNLETGWEVLTLYDEPFFPLTVQLVAWAPGMTSPIHNHGCWGLVALLSGEEKNTFWQRSPRPEFPDRIEPVGKCLLTPGDILCLMPDAIHHVEAIGDKPTISFNLYGETNYNQRFEFEPAQGIAKHF